MKTQLLTITLLLLLADCTPKQTPPQEPTLATEQTADPQPDPTQYNILAEQAVEAWLFQNLLNFESYHCLIPKIEFIDQQGDTLNYNYSTRYTATNPMGGTETNTLHFHVALKINPQTQTLTTYRVTNTTLPDSLTQNHTLLEGLFAGEEFADSED